MTFETHKGSARFRTKTKASKGVNSNKELGGKEFHSTMNGQIQIKFEINIKKNIISAVVLKENLVM